MRITILNNAIDNHDNPVELRDTLAALLRGVAINLDYGKIKGNITDRHGNIIGGYDVEGN
jgi:hypothetical protein